MSIKYYVLTILILEKVSKRSYELRINKFINF
jgi:hypothetical protein